MEEVLCQTSLLTNKVFYCLLPRKFEYMTLESVLGSSVIKHGGRNSAGDTSLNMLEEGVARSLGIITRGA